MKPVIPAARIAGAKTPITLAGVPQGMEALALAELARAEGPLAHIISDGQRMADLEQNLAFFAPDIPVLTLPGWDCLPYDRVSPGADISARRLSALSSLAQFADNPHPAILLVTVNAMLQRVPSRSVISQLGFSARAGNRLKMEDLSASLAKNGFERVDTVREVGEYAVRGGILDVFVPGAEEPVRLDFFGDTLESVRHFDPASQRTTTQAKELALNAMSEVTLEPETISRFRTRYLAMFGAATRDDALYVAISEGRRYPGMEHWLPLFHDEMQTVFDYLEGFRISNDHMLAEAASERRAQIVDHFEARQAAQSIEKGRGVQATPYKAIDPDLLYLDAQGLVAMLEALNAIRLTPFHEPENSARRVIDLPTRTGPRWAADAEADKSEEGGRANLFEKLVAHVGVKRSDGRKVLITAWTEGSLDRLLQVTDEHGLKRVVRINSHKELDKLKPGEAAAAVLAIEGGYEIDDLVVIGEQDVLGDRLVRRAKRKRRGADYISEVSGLDEGNYVVHAEHGIGQFIGLRTIEAAGAPHACLELHYAGDAKLFLPVENIELLTRYGSDSAEVQLDRLGGVAWQSRKAKLKKRLLDMAEGLIRIAAERHMRSAPALAAPEGLYDEFSARFPYDETEDQAAAIERVRDDLAAGQPMDRLVCGDVGFGKTEVALRAAFINPAGAAAFQDLYRAFARLSGAHRPGLAAGRPEGTGPDQGGTGFGQDRHRGRHPCAARLINRFCQSGAADHRRGAAFRGQAQGTAEGAEKRCSRSDTVGDTDPAHLAAGDDRRAGAVADHHAAGRPDGSANLHLAV